MAASCFVRSQYLTVDGATLACLATSIGSIQSGLMTAASSLMAKMGARRYPSCERFLRL
jgi:hypothetical protein